MGKIKQKRKIQYSFVSKTKPRREILVSTASLTYTYTHTGRRCQYSHNRSFYFSSNVKATNTDALANPIITATDSLITHYRFCGKTWCELKSPIYTPSYKHLWKCFSFSCETLYKCCNHLRLKINRIHAIEKSLARYNKFRLWTPVKYRICLLLIWLDGRKTGQ